MSPVVVAVSRNARHTFSKQPQDGIRLLAGLGVEGDAHSGTTVRHRSRRRWHPQEPNLRQVHLVAAELHDGLAAAGFTLAPGQMGDNLTTRGLDLLTLPQGTRLLLGAEAVVEVTGLRTPCIQLDRFQPGLMAAVLGHTADGRPVCRGAVMGVVLIGGEVRPGDAIAVELPPGPLRPLKPV
jgi:MOSC domain-containing protein YiiM